MRVTSQSRKHFRGTHRGYEIEIDREDDRDMRDRGRKFYIRVWSIETGMHAYDGWSHEGVDTMAQAKREALYGSCLKPRPALSAERGDQSACAASDAARQLREGI